VLLPEAGCLPELRPGEERHHRICTARRFEHEDGLFARQKHAVAVELWDVLDVERRALRKQASNRLVSTRPKRQHEHEPPRRCWAELKRG